MPHRSMIQKMIDGRTVESVLKRGSRSKDEVRALQNILYELGFDAQLNWEKYRADGNYGGSTTNAVKAFAEQNGIETDGETVTRAIAEKLIARYDTVDDLRHLHNAVVGDKVEQLFCRRSPHTTAVVALQTLLNELGFGDELNWEKYGADGDYGGGTTKAVKAFAQKEGIASDGTRLTKELAKAIIEKCKGYLGENWAKEGAATERMSGDLTIREAVEGGKERVYVSHATRQVRFTKFKKGVYIIGNQKAIDFINPNKSSLTSLGLTGSAINVMLAVSENEGNLDAINTWDNSFMTFGMFQWTIGAGDKKGELPALLKKIKDADENVFQEYYGQHGLDMVDTGEVSGYFTINGVRIATASDKEPGLSHSVN